MTEDAELLARYARGEMRAFDDIVDRYERRVFAIAARMCGPEDARDVTQDVFINAMRALQRFRGDAQLATWFHRVTVNASLDHLRKRRRHQTGDLDALPDRPDPSLGPDDRAVAASRAADVQRALGEMSEEHRAVLVLDMQQLDYGEIAEALGIPVGTVKSRMHRARLEMARRLGHLRDVEPTDASDPLRKRT